MRPFFVFLDAQADSWRPSVDRSSCSEIDDNSHKAMEIEREIETACSISP